MHVCMHGAPPNTLTEFQPHPPTPTPQMGGPEISQKSIKIERIEIFEFCLKILDLWTLVHSYRLHLVCSWGGVLSQIAYFTFGPRNVHIFCSCEPSGKNFPVFTLESDRPCLDWQSIWFCDLLTHLQPFQIRLEMKIKVQNWTKMSIYHRTVNQKKIWNVPLDALICPLQIINWYWTPIIDPSWSKRMLYPPPIQCRKLLNRP